MSTRFQTQTGSTDIGARHGDISLQPNQPKSVRYASIDTTGYNEYDFRVLNFNLDRLDERKAVAGMLIEYYGQYIENIEWIAPSTVDDLREFIKANDRTDSRFGKAVKTHVGMLKWRLAKRREIHEFDASEIKAIKAIVSYAKSKMKITTLSPMRWERVYRSHGATVKADREERRRKFW